MVESDRQAEINSGINERLNAMSGEEKQAKMMAFMMKDPTGAGKQMQDLATAGAKTQEALASALEKRKALQEQVDAAEAQYKTEAATLAPLLRRQQEASDPSGNPATARQLAAQFDTEYEKLCAKWFQSPGSPLLKHLTDLKRFLTEEEIPGGEERARVEKLQIDLYGGNSAGYKSNAGRKAVTEYMDAMTKVFGKLRSQPIGR